MAVIHSTWKQTYDKCWILNKSTAIRIYMLVSAHHPGLWSKKSATLEFFSWQQNVLFCSDCREKVNSQIKAVIQDMLLSERD